MQFANAQNPHLPRVKFSLDALALLLVGGDGELAGKLRLERLFRLDHQLRAGLVPRRELGRRRGDRAARQVTDLDLRGDLGLRTAGSGGVRRAGIAGVCVSKEALGGSANLDHREDRVVQRLRDPGKEEDKG